MGAFKIKHKETGKFLSTTAASRYICLYISGKYPNFSLEKALVTNGRVFSTRKGAENFFKKLGFWKDLFEIHELK